MPVRKCALALRRYSGTYGKTKSGFFTGVLTLNVGLHSVTVSL